MHFLTDLQFQSKQSKKKLSFYVKSSDVSVEQMQGVEFH